MPKIQNRFTQVMKKLSLLGHNQADLVDCSDVIPVPKTLAKAATFPAGKSQADVEIVVCFTVNCKTLVTHDHPYSAMQLLHPSPLSPATPVSSTRLQLQCLDS